MKRISRTLPALALLGALLAPVVWSGPIWADDFTDDVGPSDNPATPGPDLYADWKVDLGIVSMPNLVATAPAVTDVLFLSPGLGGEATPAIQPDLGARAPLPTRSSRAPPLS